MKTHTQRTFDQVFQHPITHSLSWRDVRSLFATLGEVEDERNGNLKLTLREKSVVFQASSMDDDATADQVIQIRHLLHDIQVADEKPIGSALLLVIDHQQARIFHTDQRGVLPDRVAADEGLGGKSHVHSAHDFRLHTEKPNHDAFFEAVTQSIAEGDRILVFGSGTGSSSSMDLFTVWLREHHPKISDRLVGTMIVDASHLTEKELVARARDVFANQLVEVIK